MALMWENENKTAYSQVLVAHAYDLNYLGGLRLGRFWYEASWGK
jgi:hypothetical protein